MVGGCGVDWTSVAVGYYEHGTEHLGSIKGGVFLD